MKERIDPWHRQWERLDAAVDEFKRTPCEHWAREIKHATDAVLAVFSGQPVRVPVAGIGMSDKYAMGEQDA